MCFSHVLPTMCPRWHLYALEQVSVPSRLDWGRLSHRYNNTWDTRVNLIHPPEQDWSEALFCCCLILIPFLLSCQREKLWFAWYFLNFSAPLTILFPLQPYVNYPVLTAVAVWGLISASVRQITAAHSAFCVSNKTTNTSGIIYIPSAMWITSGRGG